MCSIRPGDRMSEQQPIPRAIHLAEQILDEVVNRKQDWGRVERLATALAELARRAAQQPRRTDGSR